MVKQKRETLLFLPLKQKTEGFLIAYQMCFIITGNIFHDV